MPIRPIALKVLFGIVVFTLVIPFSPPVSLAKAKICCKKKCSKMMGPWSSLNKNLLSTATTKKSPVDCCQENCSKIITYEKPERFSIVGKRIAVESPQTIITYLSIVSDTSLFPNKFPLKYYPESYRHKIKSPPIFVIVSSFLI